VGRVTAPSTANEVVLALTSLTRELRDKVAAYRHAELDAALKRHAADLAEARAFLSAEGSVEQRKRLAEVDSADVEGEALVAEAVVRVIKAELRAIETRIEVGRTYGATVRAELSTIGYQEHP
jgi:hypothetical protein